jgi:beta-lactamase class A
MQQLLNRLPRSRHGKGRIRHWLGQYKRWLRYGGLSLAALGAILEIAQLAYPSGRILPLVEVGGQPVGGANVATAAENLKRAYADAKVTIKTDDKSFAASFDEAGIIVDTERSARDAANYPLWQRFVPFSSLAIGLARNAPMQTSFNDQKLRNFADRVQRQGGTPAVNASLAVESGRVEVVPATPSKEYPAEHVAVAVKKGSLDPRTEISVAPQTKPAALTDKEAQAMVDGVQRLVDDNLIVTLEGRHTKVDKKIVGSWLRFTANQAADRLGISLDADSVKDYLGDIQSDVYKAPGTTRIQLIDDREVSRTTGAAGRGINMDVAVSNLHKAVTEPGEGAVSLAITDLPPDISYDKKYSNSDKELASLVDGIAESKGNYGISLMEMDGRSAYANGNRQFVAASTYKLYVAYAVSKEVEAGRMSWSDIISGGRTAAQCFDDMIIVSDNDCPKAFGGIIGWSKITTMVRSLGLSNSTSLGSAMYTTPNDLAYFLYRVQNGSIVTGANRDRLISAMKRQSYTRAGIPKGTGGTVANKVGEVDGYFHDAAIVYGSKKTYILIVMSYGGSWSGVADAASQVHSYVNR